MLSRLLIILLWLPVMVRAESSGQSVPGSWAKAAQPDHAQVDTIQALLKNRQPGAGQQSKLPATPKAWAKVVPDKAQKTAIQKLWDQRQNDPQSQALREQARALVDYTQTEQYQQKMDALIGQVFPDQAKARASRRATSERLYLFVSSSIPMDVLRRYAHQVEGVPGAMMVLRGFINGATKIKPTVDFVGKLLKRDPDCQGARCKRIRAPVIVDPNLFRRYGIKRVPAVVTVSGLQTDGSCSEGNTEVVKIRGHHVSYGDVPLLTHLASLAEQGDAIAASYVELIDPDGVKNGSY